MPETQGILKYEDVVDFFLAFANECGEPLTNLKLQKLVYYAQAWYLANFNKPLFDDDFEAWVHGPVLPALYHKLKERRSQTIVSDLRMEEVSKKIGPEVIEFLKEIAKIYMTESAYALEMMTHNDSPW